MRNDNLIFQNIWNSCAGGTGSGTPIYIRDRLREILVKSREQSLFNPERLDPEDDDILSDICRDLDIMIDNLEFLEDRIRAVALLYKEGKVKK